MQSQITLIQDHSNERSARAVMSFWANASYSATRDKHVTRITADGCTLSIGMYLCVCAQVYIYILCYSARRGTQVTRITADWCTMRISMHLHGHCNVCIHA